MAEYVNREDVRKAFLKFLSKHNNKGLDWHNFKIVISTVPSVDVRVVTRGHWIIEDKYIDYRIERCSECGFAARRDYIQNYWNYCPRCGEDMRGETNG